MNRHPAKRGGGAGRGHHRAAFGGPSGLWFLRRDYHQSKKRRITPPADGCAASKTIASPPGGGEAVRSPAYYRHRRWGRRIIEWDDVRCRPVYHEACAAATSTSESSSSDDDDEIEAAEGVHSSEALDAGESTRCAGALTPVSATPWVLREVQHNRGSPGASAAPARCRTYKRTFGSRKRGTPWGFTPPPIGRPAKRRKAQRSKVDEPTVQSSGCWDQRDAAPSTAGPPTLATTPRNPGSSVDRSAPSVCNVEFEVNDSRGDGDSLTPPRQPTSSTSLSAARRFFERLDAHHPLVLDGSSSTGPTQPPTTTAIFEGRSRRNKADPAKNPLVAQEYRQHKSVCREVGVPALPWHHFLRQRKWYHSGAYDGMLDDD